MALSTKMMKEETRKLIIKILWLLLVFLGGILYTDLVIPVSRIAIPLVPKSVLLVIIALLLILVVILLLYLSSYKEKLKNPYKDYLIGAKGGIIKHKDTGLLFCPICFSNGKLSPLHDTMGYVCHSCPERLPRVKDETYLPYPLFIMKKENKS